MPEEDEYDDNLGDDDKVKNKPSSVTRAVAARERAGLNRELTPRAARGVDERADDVIEVDDDDWVQADVPMIEPRMTIKVEPEDIPAVPVQEPEQELLGRGHRKHTKRTQLTPRMKGQRHTDKEVGFL